MNSAFVATPPLLTSRFQTSATLRPRLRPHPCRQQPRAQMTEQLPPDSTRIPEPGALDPEAGAVVISPSFNLAGAFMFTGGLCFYLGDVWLVPGFPVLLIGLLLTVQSTRVRFVFGPQKLIVAKRNGEQIEFIRGWDYDQITNWEFWWPALPILAYFKEKESYNGRGSVHFFPILCNGKQLLDMLKQRTPHLDKSDYS